MYFIGLDLAWGERNPTGIAVLDESGCVRHLGSAVTDDEIAAALAPYLDAPCLVAIDAPLVVNNPTGMRPSESELNTDFQQFDAGTHSTNSGMEMFATKPRGTRIAESLGLDIDPHSTADRRAIEVYPHPATVALFRLGRTFKYKGGKGRSLEDRKSALLALINRIEGLAAAPVKMHTAANADWSRLRQDVERAQRPIELDRAEDPIDAVLCAYIALYATNRPDDITIYGDFPDNGYILTPTLPSKLKPTPRETPESHPAPATATITGPSPLATDNDRCAALMREVQTAWVAADDRIRYGNALPAEDAAFVHDSLRRVAALLELAEQQYTSICDRIGRQGAGDDAI